MYHARCKAVCGQGQHHAGLGHKEKLLIDLPSSPAIQGDMLRAAGIPALSLMLMCAFAKHVSTGEAERAPSERGIVVVPGAGLSRIRQQKGYIKRRVYHDTLVMQLAVDQSHDAADIKRLKSKQKSQSLSSSG